VISSGLVLCVVADESFRGWTAIRSGDLSQWIYFVPWLPLVIMTVFALIEGPSLSKTITPGAPHRDTQQALLVNMTAFTFAGLLAVAFLDSSARNALTIPIYCLLLSFLFYFSALNFLSNFAASVGHLLLLSALKDAGSLSLLVCIAVIVEGSFPIEHGGILSTLGLGAWTVNFSVTLWRTRVYLRSEDFLSQNAVNVRKDESEASRDG